MAMIEPRQRPHPLRECGGGGIGCIRYTMRCHRRGRSVRRTPDSFGETCPKATQPTRLPFHVGPMVGWAPGRVANPAYDLQLSKDAPRGLRYVDRIAVGRVYYGHGEDGAA